MPKKKKKGGRKTYKAAQNLKVAGNVYKAGDDVDADTAKAVLKSLPNSIYIIEQ